MFTREFWLGDSGALVRAVRTFGQTAVAMITVASFSPFDIGQWRNAAIVSATAALVSLLMSLDRRESLLAPSPTQPAQLAPAVYVADTVADSYAPPAYGCGDTLR